MDTDSYEDIYEEMDRIGETLGRKVYKIPCGGSNALGTLGKVKMLAVPGSEQRPRLLRADTGQKCIFC